MGPTSLSHASAEYCHHQFSWIQVLPRRRIWPDIVWSLSSPRLASSFDLIHPLSSVHFSSFHTLLVFFFTFALAEYNKYNKSVVSMYDTIFFPAYSRVQEPAPFDRSFEHRLEGENRRLHTADQFW